MKHAVVRKALIGIMLLVGGVCGHVSTSFAQLVEVEPNNTCATAQVIPGPITLPFTFDGALANDVDFFKISGLTPGSVVRIDLEGAATGKGTLDDPFLGVFAADAECHVIRLNDDGGIELNSRVALTVPADGVLILGVTVCCDDDFVGEPLPEGVGTYQVTVSPSAFIGSISGRVVDAQSGMPLPGAFVALLYCEGDLCDFVREQEANSEGRFSFPRPGANPLEIGTYQVFADAPQYQEGQTDPFEVTAGESKDVGDVPLLPLPIQFSDVMPCEDVPSEGGRCRYSVTLTNRLETRLRVGTWSVISGFDLGSPIRSTSFQITHSELLNLKPQESETIRFTFRVPSQVADGAEFCIDGVFAGRWPAAFFDPVGSLTGLFCIVKGISSFSLRAAAAPRGVGVKGTGTTRPKGAGPKRIIPNGARMRP